MTSHGEPANAPLRTNTVQDSHAPSHTPTENAGASSTRTSPAVKLALTAIVLLHITISIIGINWGLPSRSIDKYLFGDELPWSGEKIYRLANAADKFSGIRGADVDADPYNTGLSHDKSLTAEDRQPIPLTSTPEDVAKIYLRYRLYTYQPDEMITMMALAGMKPSKLDFDPRLYQYGGLFIYPVGALIKLCGMLGLIDVRSDVVYYLDHPDEFGKFYIVARAYSAAWGAIGVIVVFAITRRLSTGWHGQAAAWPWTNERDAKPNDADKRVDSDEELITDFIAGARIPSRTNSHSRILSRPSTPALLAAFLFTLMPVVVCMSHEGKPHLPGAVLMLIAVWLAMKYVENNGPIFFLYLSITCGAAVGMVLSSWPICILIPVVAWLNRNRSAILSACPNVPMADASSALSNPKTTTNRWFAIAIKGTLIAITIYLVTNPYIVINAFTNREVLRSNFGNSLAMYQVSRIGEGFVRVLELTVEGATWPIVILGAIAFMAAILRFTKNANNRTRALPLIVVAVVFYFQFVLIGAGKPAEYGRFGIFTNAALAIGASCLFASFMASRKLRLVLGVVATLIVGFVAWQTSQYIGNFATDSRGIGSRNAIAEVLCRDYLSTRSSRQIVEVTSEPAPYSCPPIPFGKIDLRLNRTMSVTRQLESDASNVDFLIFTLDDPRTIGLPDDSFDGSFFRGSSANMWIGIMEPHPCLLSEISWANKPIGFAGVSGRLGPW